MLPSGATQPADALGRQSMAASASAGAAAIKRSLNWIAESSPSGKPSWSIIMTPGAALNLKFSRVRAIEPAWSAWVSPCVQTAIESSLVTPQVTACALFRASRWSLRSLRSAAFTRCARPLVSMADVSLRMPPWVFRPMILVSRSGLMPVITVKASGRLAGFSQLRELSEVARFEVEQFMTLPPCVLSKRSSNIPECPQLSKQ